MSTNAPRPAAAGGPGPAKGVGRLIVQGADGPGIVAAASSILTRHGANIVSLQQHSTGPVGGQFFQRTVFGMPGFPAAQQALRADLDAEITGGLGLAWTLHDAARRKRAAIFVSRTDHCLVDLLWRQRRDELPMEIATVVSNHPDLAATARQWDVPFVHVPVAGDKAAAEREHLRLLAGRVDLVVLGRYMQILSGEFLRRVGVPVINIHHSFLPAFIGSGPYQKAKDRGVKLIGATAHYVTEDLDEGPIIEQDVIRVSHGDTVRDLVQKGADVERLVLARAVRWHCEDRVLRDGNQTVVFAP